MSVVKSILHLIVGLAVWLFLCLIGLQLLEDWNVAQQIGAPLVQMVFLVAWVAFGILVALE